MTTVAPPIPAPETRKERPPVKLDLGPRRALNIPLLVISLIVVVVLGTAGYFWHSFMVDQTAVAFLVRATALEEEENWTPASRYLHRYLQVHPTDTEVHIRLADVFDKSSKDNVRLKPRAIELYYRAVGFAPDRIDLRERLCELLLEMAQAGDRRRLPTAEKEAQDLLQKDRTNAVGLRVMALAAYAATRMNAAGSRSLENVVGLFERALTQHPEDVELATTLAHIQRNELKEPSQEERNELANAVMFRMTQAAANNPEAFLTLFKYRTLYSLPDTQEAIEKAVALGPDDLDVLLTAGEFALNSALLARQEQRWDDQTTYFLQAEKYYRRAIEIDKSSERAHLGLGHAQMVQQKAGLAIETWKNGLTEVGRGNLDLNFQIVRAQIQLGQLDEVEKRLKTLDIELEKISSKLAQVQAVYARSQLNYLRAKSRYARGEYRDAIELMRAVIRTWEAGTAQRTTKRVTMEFYDAAMVLGQSYGAQGQWDLAADAFKKAVSARTDSNDALKALADALQRAGRLEEAMKHVEALRKLDASSPTQWLAEVEADLKRQLARPKSERDWAPLHAKLNKPLEQLRRSWQLKLLEADYVIARGGGKATDTAVQFLAAAEQLHPDAPDLFQHLAVRYQRLGKPAEADRTLEKLRLLDGGTMRPSLVKAELLTLRRQFNEAKQLLEELINSANEQDKTALKYSIYRVNLQMGNFAEAKKVLLELQAANPKDVTLVGQLAELALELGQYKDVERWAQEMKKLEGADSSRWRFFEGERLVATAKPEQEAVLAQATELQKYIEDRRGTWPQGYLLKGDIALKQKDYTTAISAYQTAISLGEGRLGIYEKLIEMLYLAKRFDEVDTYLDQYQDYMLQSQSLQMIDIHRNMEKGNKQRARELAEKGTQMRPNDPSAWIRLGQAWLMEDQEENAETALRKAIEVAPQDATPWQTLFSFRMRDSQQDKALEVLEELKASQASMPPVTKALLLGRAYESLGKREEAKPYFAEAEKLGSKEVNVLIDVAAFAGRSGDDAAAKRILRQAYQDFPKENVVRVRLAEFLVRGTEAERDEAGKLLENAAIGENATPANRRILAAFMARRGGEYRQKAIEIFKELAANPEERVPADNYNLSQLYEVERKLDDAKNQLIILAGAPNADPSYLVALIEFLLRHGMAADATKWVRDFAKAEPKSLRSLSIQTRWLKAQKGTGSIEDFVEKFAAVLRKDATNPAQEEQLMQSIGQIYSQLEMHSQALRWYQELQDTNPKAYLPVAVSLSAQGRLNEAVKLCVAKAEADDTPQGAIMLAQVLGSGKPTAADFELAKPVLDKALAKYPQNQGLLVGLAMVYFNLKQHEDSVRLYEQVLRESPSNVMVLNNLAYVLLEIPNRQAEALEYIDRAIDITGARPELLDTKAMIILKKSPQQAVKLLEEATSVPSTDPRYMFHLAVAYRLAGDMAKAKTTLASADAGGLKDQLLTATEDRLLKDLRQAVGQ